MRNIVKRAKHNPVSMPQRKYSLLTVDKKKVYSTGEMLRRNPQKPGEAMERGK